MAFRFNPMTAERGRKIKQPGNSPELSGDERIQRFEEMVKLCRETVRTSSELIAEAKKAMERAHQLKDARNARRRAKRLIT